MRTSRVCFGRRWSRGLRTASGITTKHSGTLGDREWPPLGTGRRVPGRRSRIKHRDGAENVGWLRRMVLSMLKQVKGKRTLNAARLAAGWNEELLEQILREMLAF